MSAHRPKRHSRRWKSQIGTAVLRRLARSLASCLSDIEKPSGPQPSPARREGRSEEVAEKLRRFLSRHQTQYQELVQGVLQGDDQARKAFRQRFGPTAFAEAVCGKDLEEVRRVKTAVQQTREYQTLIKPVLSGQPPIDGKDRSGDDPADQVAQWLRRECPER
jgi:hypothetical protein